jgi:hypothetical protein
VTSLSGLIGARIQIVATKVRDIIRWIEEDGWRLDSQKGSHQQYVHPTKPGASQSRANPATTCIQKRLPIFFGKQGSNEVI